MSNEQSPLLRGQNVNADRQSHAEGQRDEHNSMKKIEFEEDDSGNPKNWPLWKKYLQVVNIFLVAVTGSLASSIFTPGSEEIAKSLNTQTGNVQGGTTGFVVMLGLGPLLLAPLSETFGRRKLYLYCFGAFSLLQLITVFTPNIVTFIVIRTITGFFGSVGVANGGGSVSDMFATNERAQVLGYYLLGPLLGPTIGPIFGALIVSSLGWRWIFGLLAIVCTVITTLTYFLLDETYAPVILQQRKAEKESEDEDGNYETEGEDDRPLHQKILSSSKRPLIILFTQPIVLIMSIYQALIFSTMYTMYTQFPVIWPDLYDFNTTQLGLTYFGPTVGFLIAVVTLIPLIDKFYKKLSDKYDNEGMPEYRLPIANVGAVLLPISLFWFGWCVEYHVPWAATLASTLLFGVAQVAIFNAVQNYYIDSFEKYAASAIAAGAFMRSIVGGVVPLLVPALFDKVGYGWGMSCFGFVSVALMPAPALFLIYGERVREKFKVDL